MSFFTPQAQAAPSQPNALALAEQELDMVTTIFNNIVKTCKQKCIPPKYNESDLSKAESVCIDRCVAKYFEVNKQIGSKMQGMSQQNQAQGQ